MYVNKAGRIMLQHWNNTLSANRLDKVEIHCKNYLSIYKSVMIISVVASLGMTFDRGQFRHVKPKL